MTGGKTMRNFVSQWHYVKQWQKLCTNSLKKKLSFLECEKMALKTIFRHFLQENFFMFVLLISNHTAFLVHFEINSHLCEIALAEEARAISGFRKTHSCKFIQIELEAVWLPIPIVPFEKLRKNKHLTVVHAKIHKSAHFQVLMISLPFRVLIFFKITIRCLWPVVFIYTWQHRLSYKLHHCLLRSPKPGIFCSTKIKLTIDTYAAEILMADLFFVLQCCYHIWSTNLLDASKTQVHELSRV